MEKELRTLLSSLAVPAVLRLRRIQGVPKRRRPLYQGIQRRLKEAPSQLSTRRRNADVDVISKHPGLHIDQILRIPLGLLPLDRRTQHAQ